MRNNLAPALIGSALLHVAVFGFALWKFPNETREVLNAVPVQIVSDMPALAPAPPAPPAMEETPEPEPIVEEPQPEPTPPTPEPPKPTPKPEPKVDPKAVKKDKTPPKKTEEAAVDPLSFVKDLSKASSKPKSSQATTPSKGASRSGSAEADMGPALSALQAKLMRLWSPNCGVEGAEDVVITVSFSISESGRVIRGPTLQDRRSGAVWQAASTRALSAVKRGEPYLDLPAQFYQEPIEVVFNGREACR